MRRNDSQGVPNSRRRFHHPGEDALSVGPFPKKELMSYAKSLRLKREQLEARSEQLKTTAKALDAKIDSVYGLILHCLPDWHPWFGDDSACRSAEENQEEGAQ